MTEHKSHISLDQRGKLYRCDNITKFFNFLAFQMKKKMFEVPKRAMKIFTRKMNHTT